MMVLEVAELLALFPPVARFFIALLLILVVEGGAVLFALWLISKYGKDE